MPRINKQEFRRELGELLDAIFLQDPVVTAPEYLTSSLLQLRRTLLDRENNSDTGALERPRLPPWLEPFLQIGPYERSLLQSLLVDAPHGVIMVRGGSGSGKSSTFQHIEHACAIAAADLPWNNRYGFRRFIHTIDLQAACETARSTIADTEQHPPHHALKMLYRNVTKSLDALLQKHLTDAAFVQLVVDASVFTTPNREHYTVLEGSQAHLARLLNGASAATLTRAALEATLQHLEDDDALLVRLLLLTQLARALREDDGRRLVIVVDNVDPLPALLQNAVITHLSALVSSPMWQPLRMVVLARLSTAQHHLGVLRPVTIDHKSPDPAHVVLYRLMWFFLFQASFANFAQFDDALGHAITTRLFELCRHLLDPVATVRKILSAMAGTNLRNAMDFAKAWCLSDKFGSDMTYNRAILDDFQTSLRQLYGSQVLSELDTTLGRAVDALFNQAEANDFALAVDIEGEQPAAMAWAQKFATISIGILEDLHLTCTDDDDANQIRHMVCAESRDLLATMLSDPESVSGVTAELHLAFSNAIKRIRQALASRALRSSPDTTLSTLLRNIPDALDERFAGVAGMRRDLAQPVIAWILDTIGLASSQPVTAVAVERRFLLGERSASDTRSAQPHRLPFAPITSRFIAASVLVDPGVTDPSLPSNALNVFGVDHTNVCPAILRLLYLLAKSSNGQLTVRELYDDLLLHKFTENEIRAAFRQMARTETRLIFAGLSDSNEDIDQWLSRDAVVYLSSAGRGYYHDLLATPAYLQWALADIAEVRLAQREEGLGEGTSLASRVDAALIGFEVVVDDEMRRLRRAWGTSDDDNPASDRTLRRLLRAAEMSCQSVTADLFFRSYPAFVYSLLSNYRRLQREDSKLAMRHVKEVAKALQDSGERWLDEHAEFFAYRYSPWEERMAEAAADIEEIWGRGHR